LPILISPCHSSRTFGRENFTISNLISQISKVLSAALCGMTGLPASRLRVLCVKAFAAFTGTALHIGDVRFEI